MAFPIRWQRTALATFVASAAVFLAGCSRDSTADDVAKLNKSNIQRLSNFYAGMQNGYASSKGSVPPKDEAEFKEYIRAYPADKLKMMGVDAGNIEELFKSERDGKPFKIRYKVGGGRGSVAPVIFELEGKDGKKQVGFTGGNVEDVDQSTYDQYFAGKSGVVAPGSPSGPTGAGASGGGRPSGGGPPPGAPTGPPK